MFSEVSFVVIFMVIGVAVGEQPGCRTRYEMARKWADQESDTKYWECVQWKKSEKKDCPTETKFSEPFQTCVPTQFWTAVPYYPPPSNANDEEDACGIVEVPSPCDKEFVIYCGLGTFENGACKCFEGAKLVDGVCINSLPCDNFAIHQPDTEPVTNNTYQTTSMPETDLPVSNSTDCGVGNLQNGACVCYPGAVLENGTCVTTPIRKCPGAPVANHTPGTMNCTAPICTVKTWEKGTLYPTPDPTKFFQCHSPEILKVMPCAPGTCFDYSKQVCVHPIDWFNQCVSTVAP